LTGSAGRFASRLAFPLAVLMFLGVSLTAEFRSYVRPDTGFLLDAGSRILDGQRLYVDVVEINPPLIVVVNAGAVMVARLLGVSPILIYRVGTIAVLLGSLLAAWTLVPRAIGGGDAPRRAFLLLLTFVLFPLAGQDFGEREHLVLALLVPYVLLAAARSLGWAVSTRQAVLTGLAAGLAFALKPHFVVVWLLISGYLLVRRRVPARVLVPETVAMAGLLIGYVVTVVAWTPQYFDLVRLLAGPYSRFLNDPFLHVLITGSGAVLAIFALLACAALLPRARHGELWSALAIAALGCLLAGAAQQKGLRYHFYPSFALGIVLLGLIACDTATQGMNRIQAIYRWLSASVVAAAVVVVMVQNAAVAVGTPGDSDRAQFQALVDIVRERATGSGVFVMSYHLRSAYPLLNYGGAQSASRFPHLWILAAEYQSELADSAPLRYRAPGEMGPAERYLNQAVLDDFRARRPELLIVFRNARDIPANGLRRLDYLAYFGRNPTMAQQLRQYQLVAELGDYRVYQRLAPGARRVGPPPAPEPGTRDVLQVQEQGVQLRLADPTLVIAALAFLVSLGVIVLWDRRRSGAPGGVAE
jgi:hypothetical protein